MALRNKISERIIQAFSAAAQFVTTLLLFGPSKVYLTNPHEFDFSYAGLLIYLIPASCFLTIILGFMLLLCRGSLFNRAVALICGIAVLAWLQGNILVWDYGVIDGRAINWSEKSVNGIIDACIWSLMILCAYFLSSFVKKHLKTIALLFIIIQVLSTALLVKDQYTENSTILYSLDSRHKYDFSKNRNIIIFILDMFQTDVFHELIDEDSSLKEIFPGFTYFRNALGGFPTTKASIPFLLTGKQYDNSAKFDEFKKSAYLSASSLLKVLKDNGYWVDVHTDGGLVYLDEKVVSNLGKSRGVSFDSVCTFIDISLFRSAPHYFKKYIYNNDFWMMKLLYANVYSPLFKTKIINQKKIDRLNTLFPAKSIRYLLDIETLYDILAKSNAVLENNMFKLYHMTGMHAPLRMNELLQLDTALPRNRTGYKRQARGVLTITKYFLEELKRLGIYDNSMICVIADHGYPWTGIGIKIPEYIEKQQPPQPKTPQYIRGSGIPLILIKPFDAREPLKISDVPVSLGDLPKTILSGAGIPNTAVGVSMFSLNQDQNRRRRFLHYYLDKSKTEYMTKMREYVVNGFSWLDASWMDTGREFAAAQTKQYTYGDKIEFRSEGNADLYQGIGWSMPEKTIIWTEGKIATLRLPIHKTNNDLILKVMQWPFLGNGNIKAQWVIIYINNQKIGEWHVTHKAEYKQIIPQRLLNDSTLDIVFEMPDAITPSESSLETIADSRRMGVAIEYLVVEEMKKYKYGDIIRFGTHGNSKQFEFYGWNAPEDEFTWTEGTKVKLVIPVHNTTSTLELKIQQQPFIVPGKLNRQRVIVQVNDKKAGEWVITGEGEYRLVIPGSSITENIINMEFEFPDARVPKELLAGNSDERVLGIALKSLVLEEMQDYKFGELIRFGKGGNAKRYQGEGWYEPEEGLTWIGKDTAELKIPISKADVPLLLHITQRPFLVDGKLKNQRVKISINGQKAAVLSIEHDGEYSTLIPSSCGNDKLLQIAFELPDAQQPVLLQKDNPDTRRLGIAVKSIVLKEIAPYRFGDVILFGKTGNALQYQGNGWSSPDADFTLTDGSEAVLNLPVKKPTRDLRLTIIQEPFLVENKINKQTVAVYVNDKKTGSWNITAAGKREVIIPKNYINDGVLTIQFKLPDGRAPKDIQQDMRQLGLAIKSLIIEDVLSK